MHKLSLAPYNSDSRTSFYCGWAPHSGWWLKGIQKKDIDQPALTTRQKSWTQSMATSFHPPTASFPLLCSVLTELKTAVASQLHTENCHYPALQENLHLTQKTSLSHFSAETGRAVQGSWDTYTWQLLLALGFQRHRAISTTTSSHKSGALTQRQQDQEEKPMPQEVSNHEKTKNQNKTYHFSPRNTIKCSSDTYWKEKKISSYLSVARSTL